MRLKNKRCTGILAGSACAIIVISMLFVIFPGCDNNDTTEGGGDTPVQLTAGNVEHKLNINPAGTNCEVIDSNGNSTITVNRGDYVVWHNTTGAELELDFARHKRLFGVVQAVVYPSGDVLMLRISKDAEIGEHTYSASCGSTMPGPKIIVNPPSGGGR